MLALFFTRAFTLLLLSITFFLTRSLAKTVEVFPWDTQSIQYIGKWNYQSITGAVQCSVRNATISTSGANLVFTFTGTNFSIVTAGQSAYKITQGDSKLRLIKTQSSPCNVTFQSSEMEFGEHTISVIPAGEMSLMLIRYEDADKVGDNKPLNTTITIIIATCCVIAFLAIIGTICYLCCKRTRQQTDLEKSTLRYKNNEKGVLSTTPTFVQYLPKNGHRRKSEDNPPITRDPRPIVHDQHPIHAPSSFVSPQRQVDVQSQTRTLNGSEVVTAFSV